MSRAGRRAIGAKDQDSKAALRAAVLGAPPGVLREEAISCVYPQAFRMHQGGQALRFGHTSVTGSKCGLKGANGGGGGMISTGGSSDGRVTSTTCIFCPSFDVLALVDDCCVTASTVAAAIAAIRTSVKLAVLGCVSVGGSLSSIGTRSAGTPSTAGAG